MSTGVKHYCTILSSNYLPKALALAESLKRWEQAALTILLIDVPSQDKLPEIDGVELRTTAFLGLTPRQVLDLATIYELVEFATAVKPLLLDRLLDSADMVVYLDPDTYLKAPLVELPEELAASDGGLLLTPHMLGQPPDSAVFDVGHLLNHGVYNLGFCAVDKRAKPFLAWWWSQLEFDCLYLPRDGLFVDQKWVDIGAVWFGGRALSHPGYNVGIGNLHERTVVENDGSLIIEPGGQLLRLFHFHAFDASSPQVLSTRFERTRTDILEPGTALRSLTDEYASVLATHIAQLPAPPVYPYSTDTTGRPVRRRIRRVFRDALRAGDSPPSPFVAAEANEYRKWRRRARPAAARDLGLAAAVSARWLFSEEFDRLRARNPDFVRRFSRAVRPDGGQ